MFRAVSRGAGAFAPRLQQTQGQFIARSIYTRNARPTVSSNASRVSPFKIPQIPQARQLSFSQRLRLTYREASKGIFRKNPILLPLAIFSAVSGIVAFAYISYVELTRVGPQYHKFPQPVADRLRTAVYYTEIDLNPAKALKAYKEALRIAVEWGMHPFSDEIIGIKLQVAMMLEKSGLMKPAIEILERTKKEVLRWIDEGRKSDSSNASKLKPEEAKTPADAQGKAADDLPMDPAERARRLQAWEARQRDRALKRVVGIQMKLAELYSSEYIQDEEKAEFARVSAVEICMKEMARRKSLGMPMGGVPNGDDWESWLTTTEMATALAELGDTYLAKEQHNLALPLFMVALELIREDEGKDPTCKQVVLLNNVSGAIAGQAQIGAARSLYQKSFSREEMIESAEAWAVKSLQVAARIKPPMRDKECDVTCVAARYNLGELAELQNKPGRAKKRYTEARALAKELGLEEAFAMADEALKRLSKK